MKRVSILFLSVWLLQEVSAQSSFEKDLERLKSQHEEELTAATEPIYERYKERLEELLRKASRNGSVNAAIEIRETIASLPASILVGKRHPRSAEELETFLHGTTWDISEGSPSASVKYSITFDKDGTFEVSDGRTGKFKVTGRNSFKLWNYDPATLDDNFSQFEATGTAATYFGSSRPE